MILADKIIAERKKNGWSQEELAEKVGVSRQAVSKWEGAQTTPDLQKLLILSEVFGVTSDYLLKDDMEDPDYIQSVVDDESIYRKVTMEEANEFLQLKKENAPKIALATMLCIMSPICLILLAGLSELSSFPISEDAAGGIGMIVLLLFVAIACAIFILCGAKTKNYEFLEKERIDTEYGVTGMVQDRKKKYDAQYTRYNVLGTVTCICGVLPLFAIAIFPDKDIYGIVAVCILLMLEAIGVRFFVVSGTIQGSYDMLLQEGEYSIDEKKKSPLVSAVTTVYWLLATAIFFVAGFISKEWNYAGLIWPVAGILFPAVLAIVKAFDKKKD